MCATPTTHSTQRREESRKCLSWGPFMLLLSLLFIPWWKPPQMYTVAARPQKEKECFETHPFGQQIHITTILETICTLHLLDVLYIYVAVCFALPGLLVSTTCYSSQIFQVNDPVVLPYPLGITEGLFRSSLITISSKEIKIYLKKISLKEISWKEISLKKIYF